MIKNVILLSLIVVLSANKKIHVLKDNYCGNESYLLLNELNRDTLLVNRIALRHEDDELCKGKLSRFEKYIYVYKNKTLLKFEYKLNDRLCGNSVQFFVSNFDSLKFVNGQKVNPTHLGFEFLNYTMRLQSKSH
jgi:hypothetical protein